MNVFAEAPIDNFCINRISGALKRYAPSGIEFVNDEKNADLVIMYTHGLRKKTWWAASRLMANNQKYAVVQLQLRSTPNPKTVDWLDTWEKAQVVWSYYDLPKLCLEDGNKADFNFYHAPLGVDAQVFKETPQDRKYVIAIHSKGWSRESLRDVVQAARTVEKTVLNIENPKDFGPNIEYTGVIKNDDHALARFYSRCKYVSGLRRIEGFELPVIEGLLCGARPICFDLACYRIWFDGLAEFIADTGSANIVPSLVELFKKEPKPVGDNEKELVRNKFNWEKIAQGFWDRI